MTPIGMMSKIEVWTGFDWIECQCIGQLDEGDIFRKSCPNPDGTFTKDPQVFKCKMKPGIHMMPIEFKESQA